MEPWKKLTSVQVVTSVRRIHNGGGLRLWGSLKMALLWMKRLSTYISKIVSVKPNSGPTSSEMPVSPALLQFTAAPWLPGSSEKAMPTPRMEPIRAWELEAGIP